MGQITVERNAGGIEGLCVITPQVHGDARGYFMETWNRRDMEEAGITLDFVQDNQSASVKGVLRGLHFQIRHPQAKLVRVIRGAVYDVVVDLRPGSATFGQHHGDFLTAENHRQMLVPRGFAHGFLVLSEEAEFCYKCDDFYHPGDEGGIAWNDPELGIAWPELAPDGAHLLDGTVLQLSDRDRCWKGLRETMAASERGENRCPG